ncbi:MAG TPA: threonine dehydratase [Gemmatimonadaceae bacterium]|nr:threonine dehydratase [Gemmatimonadaceae bacterium]
MTTPALPGLEALEAADRLVKAVMPATPQYRWPLIERLTGTTTWVKHENYTPLGAFKVRGGLVYMDQLKRTQPQVAGVVSATRGNHGQSVAFAAARHGLRALVVVPRGNSREKNDAMRALGAELVEQGDDFQAALEHAAALARERGWHPMPAFDPALVAGVSTYSLEFLRAVPSLQTVYVPIGLGSGICGMLAAREALGHAVEVVGVVSSAAPAYKRSLEGPELVSCPAETVIADGVACRTPNAAALGLMRGRVARVVAVSDAEVEQAMRDIFQATHNVVEGAGALGLAALRQERDAMRGRTAGIVFTGANVDADVFARVLSAGGGQR